MYLGFLFLIRLREPPQLKFRNVVNYVSKVKSQFGLVSVSEFFVTGPVGEVK